MISNRLVCVLYKEYSTGGVADALNSDPKHSPQPAPAPRARLRPYPSSLHVFHFNLPTHTYNNTHTHETTTVNSPIISTLLRLSQEQPDTDLD